MTLCQATEGKWGMFRLKQRNSAAVVTHLQLLAGAGGGVDAHFAVRWALTVREYRSIVKDLHEAHLVV